MSSSAGISLAGRVTAGGACCVLLSPLSSGGQGPQWSCKADALCGHRGICSLVPSSFQRLLSALFKAGCVTSLLSDLPAAFSGRPL